MRDIRDNSRTAHTQQFTMKFIMMLIASLFLAFATVSAVDLTPANFDAEIKGSKNAFVKFLAPW